jgi:hypothetical protein
MLAARDVSCNGDNVSLPGSLDLSLFPYSAHWTSKRLCTFNIEQAHFIEHGKMEPSGTSANLNRALSVQRDEKGKERAQRRQDNKQT